MQIKRQQQVVELRDLRPGDCFWSEQHSTHFMKIGWNPNNSLMPRPLTELHHVVNLANGQLFAMSILSGCKKVVIEGSETNAK